MVVREPVVQAEASVVGLFRDEVLAESCQAPSCGVATYFKASDVHRPEARCELSANRTVLADGISVDEDSVGPDSAGQQFGIECEEGATAGTDCLTAGGTPGRVRLELVHGASEAREGLFDPNAVAASVALVLLLRSWYART
jgi:hypothetical protein